MWINVVGCYKTCGGVYVIEKEIILKPHSPTKRAIRASAAKVKCITVNVIAY